MIYVKFNHGEMHWHKQKNLEDWFKKLTPEQRLDISIEIEGFRKEAKFVKVRENLQKIK